MSASSLRIPARRPPTAPVRRRLGRGRSGVVYAEPAPDGSEVAAKVFRPDTASTLVMTILTGAENPYRWSRAAVQAAVCRRRILEPLVRHWFGGRVRLPRTVGWGWDAEEKAYVLRAERIMGRHARLRHPADRDQADESRDLVRQVLKPLQARLAEAGFEGLLWQAGLGNPVAAANFMREIGPDARARWVWIDLESGVPALFPMNPWRLFSTYLPLTDKYGRLVFDDVDLGALRRYCKTRKGELLGTLGIAGWNALCQDVSALEAHQKRWKRLDRTEAGVAAHLMGGHITRAQARHYWRRPVAWAGQLLLRGARRIPRRLLSLARPLLGSLHPRRLGLAFGRWSRFFLSERIRARWAARHVRRRLRDWRERGFMSADAAARIRRSMVGSEAAEYLADFGVHLALKPFFKALQWGLVPLLYALGVIDSGWLAAGLVLCGGAIGRTLYTAWRIVRALSRRHRAPWAALGAGLVPVAGNVAYPVQLLWSASGEEGLVARFLIHDIFCTTGRHVPIWGGRDTLVEHRANDVARFLLRARRVN